MNINSQGNGVPSLNSYPVMNQGLTSGKKIRIEKPLRNEGNHGIKKEDKNLNLKENNSESRIIYSDDGDILELSEHSVSKHKSEKKAEGKTKEAEQNPAEIQEGKESSSEAKRAEEERDGLREAEQKREAYREAARVSEEKAKARAEMMRPALEDDDTKEPEASFAGKTESDIARMYLKGDISKAEYDSVIESREKKREVISKKEERLSTEILKNALKEEEMVRFERELKLAFSGSENRKFSPSDRLEALDAVIKEDRPAMHNKKRNL